jgi:hypothetical protein
LDPAQVAAVADALRSAIGHEIRWIPSIAQRRAVSDWSGDDEQEEEGGHPDDRHLWYPPI